MDTPGRFKALARLLSRLTDNISIILGPTLESVRAVRVEFYPALARRVLMVVVLENAEVRTGLVDLPEDTPGAGGRRGRPAADRPGHGPDRGRDPAGRPGNRGPGRHTGVPLRRGPGPGGAGPVPGLRPRSRSNSRAWPTSWKNPNSTIRNRCKALIRFMESPAHIRESLDRLEPASPDGFGVWIGGENPVGELRRFSLLTGRYRPGRPAGAAGGAGSAADVLPAGLPRHGNPAAGHRGNPGVRRQLNLDTIRCG